MNKRNEKYGLNKVTIYDKPLFPKRPEMSNALSLGETE